jgi:hypothetical protein
MSLRKAFSAFALAGMGVLAAMAQQPAPATAKGEVDLAMLKKALSEDRRTMFRAGMNLPAKDLETFWSIYADYEKERDALAERRLAMVKDYATKYEKINDEEAKSFVSRAAEGQVSEVGLRKKYSDTIASRISGRAAARFWQIDDYISTAVRLDVMESLPLVSAAGQ